MIYAHERLLEMIDRQTPFQKIASRLGLYKIAPRLAPPETRELFDSLTQGCPHRAAILNRAIHALHEAAHEGVTDRAEIARRFRRSLLYWIASLAFRGMPCEEELDGVIERYSAEGEMILTHILDYADILVSDLLAKKVALAEAVEDDDEE